LGGIHSVTVASAFSLLKRGIYGTFHNVSRKHLHRYVAEFDFPGTRAKLTMALALCAPSRTLKESDCSIESRSQRLASEEEIDASEETRTERRTAEGDWKDTMKKLLQKKRPPAGWPKN